MKIMLAKVAKAVGGFVFWIGAKLFPIVATAAVGVIGLLGVLTLAKSFVGFLSISNDIEGVVTVFAVYGTCLFVYAKFMWGFYRRTCEWINHILHVQGWTKLKDDGGDKLSGACV